MKNYNVRVRLKPSGTGIGRLLPLKKKRVIAFLGSDPFLLVRGFMILQLKLGPQNLRVILARPNTFGIAVPANTDTYKISDLKGKRVAYTTATVNVKVEAIMSFANLTWNDVTKTVFPAFTALLKLYKLVK